MSALVVLPYLQDLVSELTTRYPAAWRHATSQRGGSAEAEQTRLALLRDAAPLLQTESPRLHQLLDEVRVALGVTVPVNLYRGPDIGVLNAALIFRPEVATIMLHGDIEARLSDEQQRALLAHELAHWELLMRDEGRYDIAGRTLALLAAGSENVVEQTYRLYALHTEVYCDRASLRVAGYEATAQLLIRATLGLESDRALEASLARAEEAWAEFGSNEGVTHPASWVRLLLLRDWHENPEGADEDVLARLRVRQELSTLDLLGQLELDGRTRALVSELLAPAYMQTERMLGYAAMFFDEERFSIAGRWDPAWLRDATESLKTYVSAVLLDFALADPELEELPLCRAHALCSSAGVAAEFEHAMHAFARRTKKSIRELKATRDERLAAADAELHV